jgi:hypothetical protein
MASRKDKRFRGELVPLRDPDTSTPGPIRADIKAMVQQARASFKEDIIKVLTETGTHAEELERAIGDLSQAEALSAVKQFFVTEMDRQLAKYS